MAKRQNSLRRFMRALNEWGAICWRIAYVRMSVAPQLGTRHESNSLRPWPRRRCCRSMDATSTRKDLSLEELDQMASVANLPNRVPDVSANHLRMRALKQGPGGTPPRLHPQQLHFTLAGPDPHERAGRHLHHNSYRGAVQRRVD